MICDIIISVLKLYSYKKTELSFEKKKISATITEEHR